MRKKDIVALGVCAATAVFCVMYIIEPPGPRYYPLEHTWSWTPIPDSPAMGWYSRVTYGVVPAAVVLVITALAAIRKPPEGGAIPGRAGVMALTAAMTAILVAAAAHIVYSELVHLFEVAEWDHT